MKNVKWCPFNKKGTILVPLCKRALFPTFCWKTVPFFLKGHYFSAPLSLFLYSKCMEKQCSFGKWHQNGVPKGTVLRTIKGHHFGATYFFECKMITKFHVSQFYWSYPLHLSMNFDQSSSKDSHIHIYIS